MGKFKKFFFKHLGKGEDAKNLYYTVLVENEYNNFLDFRLLENDDIPESRNKKTRKLVKKLFVLKDFVALGGDYNCSSLSFEDIHLRITEAKLKRCLISQLDKVTTHVTDKEFMEMMKKQFAAQLDPYETISESHYSQQDSDETRNNVIAFYGLQSKKHCQVLGPHQPEHVKIVNAHIWPRHATDQLIALALERNHVHNPRNVLRLHQCLERAFDRKEVTFVLGDQMNEFKLKILKEELKNTKLKGTKITFGSIEGRSLQILKEGSLPYRRLLGHHTILSYRHAKAQGWIESTQDLSHAEVQASNMMEHSLDNMAQARIKLFLDRKE